MLPNATSALAIPTKTKFSWPEFWVLTCAGLVGVLASLPMILPLLENTPSHIKLLASIPVWALASIRVVQTAILVALFVALGIWLSKRCGLGAPIVEAWLAGQRVGKKVLEVLRVAVPAGLLAGAVILAAEKWYFAPRLPELSLVAGNMTSSAIWQGFLASFYGGITEELLLRFGVLTLFVWALAKVSHTADGLPTAAAFWAANLLAAILFGVGHLPATAAMGVPLTKIVVLRAIVLNGVAGVVFGYLYWKQGLESAMVAHFSGDLVLHVFAPAWLLWFKP
jgi:hypothetical protein